MMPPETSDPVIETFVLGPHATNCRIIHTGGPSPLGWLCDVGLEPGAMLERARELGLEPEAIVLTHAHVDHIGGVLEARSVWPDCPIWIHAAEEAWLGDPMLNLSAALGIPVTAPTPDRLLGDNETIELAGQGWEVRHTPGHSPGGVSLIHHASSNAIVGDALFAGSIGRTDFPGSSFETLEASIRTRLYTLPDETVIHTGHGPTSTIGREKSSNPFVSG